MFNNKVLLVALFAIALTGCGGSSSKKSSSSVAASSKAASVAASSKPASSTPASSTPASSVAASSVVASSVVASSSVASSSVTAALVIYEEDAVAAWPAWDCCGGTTPLPVASGDVDHGQVVEFAINNSTVVGFTGRNSGGAPYDASSLEAEGTISFDLKMTHAPTEGVIAWKFKVESNGGAAPNGAAKEFDLFESQEGHTTPLLNIWQTYTFNISDLGAGGLDLTKLDLFMIFPAYSHGSGAIYQVDNVKIFATGAQ